VLEDTWEHIGILLTFISGLFALAGVIYWQLNKTRATVTKQRDELEMQKDDNASKLINMLKDEVESLTRKFREQEEKVLALEGKVEKLEIENKKMTDILRGNDPDTVAFREMMTQTAKLVADMYQILSKKAA
jgi:predicted RNase H-like nuclease (RuvC/YqgF family)